MILLVPFKTGKYQMDNFLFPGGFNFANITCHVIEFGGTDLITVTYFYHMSRSRLTRSRVRVPDDILDILLGL